MQTHHQHSEDQLVTQVRIPVGRVTLTGDLVVPSEPTGIIVFAHGSGSARASPRNRAVSDTFVHDGFATLLFDLLTREEETADRYTGHLRFDIALLANRLVGAIKWLGRNDRSVALPLGVFGASAGTAAALIAAARLRDIGAIVSRSGRPDLANDELPYVRCPTLLIVGGDDPEVLELNRYALHRMSAEARLHVVPGAGHLFEEPGAMREVTIAAGEWFHKHLGSG